MATPFAFVPRTVSKRTKEWQGISKPSPPPDPTTDSEPEDEDDEDASSTTLDEPKCNPNAVEQAHSKQSAIAQDIASLVSLALSDYTIWLDADLRWKLDACLADDTNDAGFVPINYILRHAPFRGALHLDPSETEVVKALRAHANHTIEVRMRLPSSALPSASVSTSASVWYGTGKTSRKKDVGGYEVRRRDWATLRCRTSRGWTRARWDDLTAYVEYIPPQYRTIGGIARFAEALLPPSLDSETDAPVLHPRIQCVTLPPHYLDKPGDTPKCKGYALVTFSAKSQLEAVLRAWPWRRRVPVPTKENETGGGGGGEEGDVSPVVKEAHKYGLRAISKARWDVLNEEYLLYKQHLVDDIARTETHAVQHEHDEPSAPAHPYLQTQTHTTHTTHTTPYPFDCLVFVRNVHPETNKTTLRSLFAQAFQDGTGLDYVDFTKGMDTCYLRLASPRDTTQLIDHFGVQPKAQADGLDATSRTPIEGDKPITIEKIQGTKEALYWEKVPEKVRRQAVDKAVMAQLAPNGESTTNGGKKRTREQ